jgi:hypothetical protein
MHGYEELKAELAADILRRLRLGGMSAKGSDETSIAGLMADPSYGMCLTRASEEGASAKKARQAVGGGTQGDRGGATGTVGKNQGGEVRSDEAQRNVRGGEEGGQRSDHGVLGSLQRSSRS